MFVELVFGCFHLVQRPSKKTCFQRGPVGTCRLNFIFNLFCNVNAKMTTAPYKAPKWSPPTVFPFPTFQIRMHESKEIFEAIKAISKLFLIGEIITKQVLQFLR